MKKRKVWLLAAILSIVFVLSACEGQVSERNVEHASAGTTERALGGIQEDEQKDTVPVFSPADIEQYADQPYAEVNNNEPYFSQEDFSVEPFEYYSDLDDLGRCGVAYANICLELMPTEDRESISHIKPTGWHSVRYDHVDGKSLYNRCHLIGFQLAGENANEKNLITGTRYMNVDGMLPFENIVANYVKETENHVLYRVSPVFEGDNLVASGVLMEAESVEDQGEGVCFCVYVYNVQPGVAIDYVTGESSLAESAQGTENQNADYILNINTKKFHTPQCSSVSQMKESNKETFTGSREDVIVQGYTPCDQCNP